VNIGVATGHDLEFFRIEARHRPQDARALVAGKDMLSLKRPGGNIGLDQAGVDLTGNDRPHVFY